MSIRAVVTRGYGSFGTIPDVVTRGYTPGAATSSAVGAPPRKRYRTRWREFGPRPTREQLQYLYEKLQAEARTAEQQGTPEAPELAQVAEEVVDVIRPYAASELEIPSLASIDWSALIANQQAYDQLLLLYERAARLDMEEWEELLLIATLAW